MKRESVSIEVDRELLLWALTQTGDEIGRTREPGSTNTVRMTVLGDGPRRENAATLVLEHRSDIVEVTLPGPIERREETGVERAGSASEQARETRTEHEAVNENETDDRIDEYDIDATALATAISHMRAKTVALEREHGQPIMTVRTGEDWEHDRIEVEIATTAPDGGARPARRAVGWRRTDARRTKIAALSQALDDLSRVPGDGWIAMADGGGCTMLTRTDDAGGRNVRRLDEPGPRRPIQIPIGTARRLAGLCRYGIAPLEAVWTTERQDRADIHEFRIEAPPEASNKDENDRTRAERLPRTRLQWREKIGDETRTTPGTPPRTTEGDTAITINRERLMRTLRALSGTGTEPSTLLLTAMADRCELTVTITRDHQRCGRARIPTLDRQTLPACVVDTRSLVNALECLPQQTHNARIRLTGEKTDRQRLDADSPAARQLVVSGDGWAESWCHGVLETRTRG